MRTKYASCIVLMFTPEVIEGGRVDLLSQDVTDCGVSDHIQNEEE